MELSINKKIAAVIIVGIVLVYGCMPGISVRKTSEKEDQTVVEYRLGMPVEMEEWVALKRKVCDDLNFATEGLSTDVRQDIFKYSCIENNENALGATLAALQPGQVDQICARLSKKGHNAKSEKVLNPTGQVAAGIVSVVAIIAMF